MLGINWGIDFAGGTELQVKFNPTVDAPAIYSPPVEVEQLPNPNRIFLEALKVLA